MEILELTGLPGCGKSTVCKELKKYYENSGKIVYTYSVVTRPTKTLLRKMLFTFYLVFRPDLWGLIHNVISYAKCYTEVSIGSLYTIIALWYFCKKKKNSDAMVILDEGFVQNITSIAHLNIVKKNRCYKKICDRIKNLINIKVVDCRIDLDEDISRLRKRNSGDRFNSIENDIELKKALEIKQKNIDIVRADFDTLGYIDMNKNPNQIMQQMKILVGD